MLDTRRRIHKILNSSFKERLDTALAKFIISLIFSLLVAFLPDYSGLSLSGILALFILFFAACLWVSEAIPAFSVSLLIVALNILLLGFDGFDFANKNANWEIYLAPWSSPLVFLFFAGFIMGSAASKTKLDLWFAKKVLFFAGKKPENVLTAVLMITFCFSMFISNTATTAMMITIVTPIIYILDKKDKFAKAILLAVTIGANIGGMGTIIGTPPNAIAVGILGDRAPDFLLWMLYGAVPAFFIATMLRFYLLKMYPSSSSTINIDAIANINHFDDSTTTFESIPSIPSWKKIVVVVTFFCTILLWLTNSFHHIPTTVVSLLPVVAFTIFKILDVEDIRELRWDIIILIVGGLSLGIGISKSGLALWFASIFDLSSFGLVGFVLIFSYIVVIVSNFMSNSAASNVILPLVVAFSASFSEQSSNLAVIAVALSASFAMCLPVSTPPNAIVFSTNKIDSKDLLKLGLLVGLFAPIITSGWIYILSIIKF